ncbi:hypothetical protein CSUB01_07944 [Colletotrichum sublineola]|uniref:Uncharacterized protein n=1 Tax=Colletotrichum sublineola TaxID=1173701 RepID=A0A066XS08_COLSU|nr:hypothetical protein CSUB01_07944 [Colletotrichum sublineola]
MNPSILFPFLIVSACALRSLHKLCISEPPLMLVAGESTVQATSHSPFNQDCRAAIYFSNPAFPPITYPYGSGSCHYGAEKASFLVPLGVPNGEAFVTWTCGTVAQACLRAIISEGRGDQQLSALLEGNIDCEIRSYCNETTRLSVGQTGFVTSVTSAEQFASMPSLVRQGSSLAQQSTSMFSSPSRSASTPPQIASPESVPALGSELRDTSQSVPPSTTTGSTEGSSGGDGFAQVSSASSFSVPSVAQSLLTVTRTVTALFTTTLIAAAR